MRIFNRIGYVLLVLGGIFCGSVSFSQDLSVGDVERLRVDAMGGSAEAQYNLGIYYYDNYASSKDFVYAYVWFGISGFNGYADGVVAMKAISQDLTEEQIKRLDEVLFATIEETPSLISDR